MLKHTITLIIQHIRKTSFSNSENIFNNYEYRRIILIYTITITYNHL